MPGARMRAQVGKLHANDVDFLGLKTQWTIELFELLRRHIGRAVRHHAGKHLAQHVVFPLAARVGHDGQMFFTLRVQEMEQSFHCKFQGQVVWIRGIAAALLQMGLFLNGRDKKGERHPIHDVTQLRHEFRADGWIEQQRERPGGKPNIPAMEIDALVIEVTEFELIEFRQNLILINGTLHQNQRENEQRKITVNLIERMVAAFVEERKKTGFCRCGNRCAVFVHG